MHSRQTESSHTCRQTSRADQAGRQKNKTKTATMAARIGLKRGEESKHGVEKVAATSSLAGIIPISPPSDPVPCATPNETPVDIIRHAHGVHNDSILPVVAGKEREAATCVRILSYNVSGELIVDPPLSIRGMDECERFRQEQVAAAGGRFAHALIASSPFKRNLMSALLMFGEVLAARPEGERCIVLDPALQERNNAGCNLGSSTAELKRAFAEWVDFGRGGGGGGPDEGQEEEEEQEEETEITTQDLVEAWLASSASGLGTKPVEHVWLERGWLDGKYAGQLVAAMPRAESRGRSVLGEALMARECRRRLRRWGAALQTVKLLVVGDDIAEQDWLDKRDMVYRAPPRRCFAPFPDLFVPSLSAARANMATRYAGYGGPVAGRVPGGGRPLLRAGLPRGGRGALGASPRRWRASGAPSACPETTSWTATSTRSRRTTCWLTLRASSAARGTGSRACPPARTCTASGPTAARTRARSSGSTAC